MKFLFILAVLLAPCFLLQADCEEDCKKAQESCLKLPLALGNCQEDYNRCARLCQRPTTLPVKKIQFPSKVTI